ncbi:MAG: type II secretion system F family protein [Acidobacteria bacterium]|nr:type II secretion system F family protein [Acidobacteriota bacterium]
MQFRCKVATATGQVSQATYSADNEQELRRDLEGKGLHLLSLRPVGGVGVGRFSLQLGSRKKISSAEFLIFNQEMATLLHAGLPLVQSLDILRRRVPNPTLKAVLNDVYDRVRSGSALSDAFEAQGGIFTGIYHASLMAGEKSGSLETVLRRYVAHMKILSSVRSRMVSALIYPIVLLGLAGAVVGLIVFKVVPEFAQFYAGFGTGVQLPASTQFIVAISTGIVDHVWLWLAVILVVGIGGSLWVRQPGQRRRLDNLKLRLPWFGPLSRKFSTAQVTRTISTLLAGGIPLVNALDISSKSVGNLAVATDLDTVAREVREGSSLHQSLSRRGTFPDVAIEMVEVGESTGALAEMLNSIADFYDEENEISLTRFTNLVQPVLLIVMGIVIAGLLLSLYMPLFQLSSLAR